MELQRVRSYHEEVLDRLSDLAKTVRDVSIRFMGGTERGTGAWFGSYPLFYVTIGNEQDHKLRDICISAGVHGEEPAGVFALLKFLEEDISDFADNFRFLVFPCVSPFGFEHNHRFNARGLNVNREFKTDTLCLESKRVMRVLGARARKFVCAIDLHETDPNFEGEGSKREDNPTEFYLWEVCPEKNLRIGDKVIREVEKFVSICKWPFVYKDVNSGGVIWYPEGCLNEIYAQRTTLEGFLADNHSPQVFTLETPCGWHMNQRIFAHRMALRILLELKRNA